jgi:hypothetical protein
VHSDLLAPDGRVAGAAWRLPALLVVLALLAWWQRSTLTELAGLAGVLPAPGVATVRASTPIPASAPPAAAQAVAGRPLEPTEAAGACNPVCAEGAVVSRPLLQWLAEIGAEAGLVPVLDADLDEPMHSMPAAQVDWRARLAAFARVADLDYRIEAGVLEVRRQGRGHPAPQAATEASSAADRSAAPVAAGSQPPDGDAEPSRAASRIVAADGIAAASSEATSAPSRAVVLRPGHAGVEALAKALAPTAKAVDVRIGAEPRSGALLLSGPAAAVDELAGLVDAMDVPRRRILLQARIVEASRSASRELGVQWSVGGGDFGAVIDLPAAASPGEAAALLVANSGSPAIEARVAALESAGRLRVVSSPRVVALEGSAATIESVRILRIRLPSRGAVVGDDVVEVDGSRDRATEEVPVGVRLEVVPAVQAGGAIRLAIRAKSSSLGPPLPPDDIPEEVSRMVEAEVLVADGETVVLGGLHRQAGTRSEVGVPVLREIPGLGRLFGRRARDREDEELLVLVRPTVLASAQDALDGGSR